MILDLDSFELAKSVRLNEIDARIDHCKGEYEYWIKQYCDSGDRFSQGMVNVSLEIWQDFKRLKENISRPSVVCMPQLRYRFPSVLKD